MKQTKNKIVVLILTCGILGTAFAGTKLLAMRTMVPPAKVTPWQAAQIATNRVPGQVFSVTYAPEGGHWGYDIIVIHNHKGSEIEVAGNGKIGDVEAAIPSDEGTELQHDLKSAFGK